MQWQDNIYQLYLNCKCIYPFQLYYLICEFLPITYIFPWGFIKKKYNIRKSNSKFYLFWFLISCYFKYLYIINISPRKIQIEYPIFKEKFNLNFYLYPTHLPQICKKILYPEQLLQQKKSIQIWTVKGDCEFPFYIFLKSKKNYNKIIPCIWGFIGSIVRLGIELLLYLPV